MSGQEAERAFISNVTNSKPCIVTTTEANPYNTGDFVRLTDMNSAIPVLRGMDQINNGKFLVEKVSSTEFAIKNPLTGKYIDSTNFTPYVTGGRCAIVQSNFIYSGD